MATATYVPLATTTLGSAQNAITFSSIPGTYTDLKLVVVCTDSTAGNSFLQFNSDTATNYSNTALTGAGTSAASFSNTSQTSIYITQFSGPTANPGLYSIDVFNYAGSTYKSILASAAQDKNGSGSVEVCVGLWRSTTAINSVTFFLGGGYNMTIGSTLTLYGIKSA